MIEKVASAVFPTLSTFIPHVLQRRQADRAYAMSQGLAAPSSLVDNALEYISDINSFDGKVVTIVMLFVDSKKEK